MLFDSCWDPTRSSDRSARRSPACTIPAGCRVPARRRLQDPNEYPRLKTYVTGVVSAFGKDPRVLGWDVWNEPDNTNTNSYGATEPKNKVELVLALLPQVFAWAREAGAEQPLTSGVWKGDWSSRRQALADGADSARTVGCHLVSQLRQRRRVREANHWLQRYHRPILCTEYMARGNGSTFEGSLPIAKKYKVAAINWGFVAGKTQTYLPWDSWQKPYADREPAVWFHEIFKQDGTPYKQEEVALIRLLTASR